MEYVSILSSILTPQCALERDHEQALKRTAASVTHTPAL